MQRPVWLGVVLGIIRVSFIKDTPFFTQDCVNELEGHACVLETVLGVSDTEIFNTWQAIASKDSESLGNALNVKYYPALLNTSW